MMIHFSKFLILLFFCGFFSPVFAGLEINEIMYDPEGSDTNREWIEIYNNGSSVINVEEWFFYENDIYHGLFPDGFTSLAPGDFALIVKDLNQVQTELGSGIKFVKSSFSLNNTGELLAMADASRTHTDSYTYQAGSGANGIGQSLQKISGNWSANQPTPGAQNKISRSSSSTENESGSPSYSSSDSNIEAKEIIYEVLYKPEIIIPDVIVSQVDFDIQAHIIREEGPKKVRKLSGYYYLNYGDGYGFDTLSRIEQSYRYRSPGNYIMVFEYYTSRLAFDAGEKPKAIIQKNIQVLENKVLIAAANQFNGVTIQNNTNKEIILDNWKLGWKHYEYSFPRNSYIRAGESINILYSTLGFTPVPTTYEALRLMSNAYKPIDIFPKYIKKQKPLAPTKKSKPKIKTPEPENKTEKEFADTSKTSIEGDFFERPDSYLDEYLSDNPDKLQVDFDQSTPAVETSSGNSSQRNMYYALGALVLMLGSARIIKQKNFKKDTDGETLGAVELIE